MLNLVPKMPNLLILDMKKFLKIRVPSRLNTYLCKIVEKVISCSLRKWCNRDMDGWMDRAEFIGPVATDQ